MKYLFVKFFRDLKNMWAQFFAVFMMAGISMAIFAGMNGVWTCMDKSSEEYFEDTNLADIWIYASSISDEDCDEIKELEYVSEAAGSMTMSVDCKVNGSSADIQITTFSDDTVCVMNPIICSGSAMEEDQDGIWVDEDFAQAHSISEGDLISISVGGRNVLVTVKGVVLHSEYIYFITSVVETTPDHEKHGYGYISESYAQSLLENIGGVSKNQIRLSLTDDAEKETDDIKAEMEDIFGDRLYSVTDRSDTTSIWTLVDQREQIKTMAMLFSLVFILLALLTMYTTMSRLANNQLMQIGTMRAFGYHRGQIYFHYALYGFIISILGELGGVLFGLSVISPIVINVRKATLTLPEWNISLSNESLYVALLITGICTFASMLTVRKVVRAAPAVTIRGDVEQGSISIKRTKRSRLSYDWVWCLRSMRIHPARYAMGTIAIIGSLTLMVAGVGIRDSLNYSYDHVFSTDYTYAYAGTVKNATYDMLKREFADMDVQYCQTISADFTCLGNEESGVLTIISEGDFVNLVDSETGESVQPESGGAMMTAGLADELGVSAGDTVSYTTSSSSEVTDVVVASIVDIKMPQGIFIYDEEYDGTFSPDTVYLGGEREYDAAQDSDCVSGITSIEDQRATVNSLLESVQAVVYILILGSIVLSSVILYNLGTLNFVERYREYATLKVLGFYKKELRAMVLKDSFITTAVGYILGIPASMRFLALFVKVSFLENIEGIPYITAGHFAAILIFVFVFSLIINLFVCVGINKVDMVEAMKAND